MIMTSTKMMISPNYQLLLVMAQNGTLSIFLSTYFNIFHISVKEPDCVKNHHVHETCQKLRNIRLHAFARQWNCFCYSINHVTPNIRQVACLLQVKQFQKHTVALTNQRIE